jgi:uroporphyrinogen-III synthase
VADPPLAGARILVPPARPEVNPLAQMLSREGATALYFPALVPRFPSSWATVDEALDRRHTFDWIVFSGTHCVHNWLQRAAERSLGDAIPARARVMAIGHGAVRALRTEGRPPDHVPEKHVAEEITRGLRGLDGARMLLVRLEGATERLPRALSIAGARVSTADGYEMAIRASAREARQLSPLDVVALASPTTVRFLDHGSRRAGVPMAQLIGDAQVTAVGDATARAARTAGLEPGLVSSGHIADLADDIVTWWRGRPMHRRGLTEQADAFIAAFERADEPAREVLRAEGGHLVRRLRSRAMELAQSRATEFSPEIARHERQADEIGRRITPSDLKT